MRDLCGAQRPGSHRGFSQFPVFSFLFIKLTRFADSTPDMRCPVPVNLILDEFNNIGKLGGAADGSDFARTLSVVRSRAIYVTLAVQSLGQLQNRYPNNLWAEIVGNCDLQVMLGCTDDLTAEYFSSRSGDMSIQVNSTMTVRQTMALAQVIPQYRQTQGQGKRRLLTPDEVLRLPNQELLVVDSRPQPAEAGKGGLHRAAPIQGDRPQQRAGVQAGTASQCSPRRRRLLSGSEEPPRKTATKAAAVRCFQAAGRLLNQLPKKEDLHVKRNGLVRKSGNGKHRIPRPPGG